MIRMLPWSMDRWLSTIDRPFTHPDKLGHLVVHFAATLLIAWLVGLMQWHSNLLIAWIWDLCINTHVEITDGTRPRRDLMAITFPVAFGSQEEYEWETIEGFSLKDWLAGLAGSSIAVWMLL